LVSPRESPYESGSRSIALPTIGSFRGVRCASAGDDASGDRGEDGAPDERFEEL